MKTSQSPVPSKAKKQVEQELSFFDALKELVNGAKIHRKEWEDMEEYGLLKDNFLTIHRKDKFYTWIVSEGDLLAIDWVILK